MGTWDIKTLKVEEKLLSVVTRVIIFLIKRKLAGDRYIVGVGGRGERQRLIYKNFWSSCDPDYPQP